jgi:hypothetical protein
VRSRCGSGVLWFVVGMECSRWNTGTTGGVAGGLPPDHSTRTGIQMSKENESYR